MVGKFPQNRYSEKMPKLPVKVWGEAAGEAAGAVWADSVSGNENAAETAVASNSLRMAILLFKVWEIV